MNCVKLSEERPSARLPGGWVVWRTGQALSLPSGREWQGAQSRQGSAELVFPGPALGKMQGEAAGLAGEPSGQGEETPSEGLGGHHRFAQPDAGGPAGQVVGDDLDGQPGGVGGEAACGEMVKPHAVLSGRGWHSRSQRGGDGPPRDPGCLRPGR